MQCRRHFLLKESILFSCGTGKWLVLISCVSRPYSQIGGWYILCNFCSFFCAMQLHYYYINNNNINYILYYWMNKSLISTIYVRLYVRFTMALCFKNYSHAKFTYLLLWLKMAKYFLEYMTLEMVSEGEKMQRDSGKIWNWLSTDASTTNKKQQQWIDNPSLKKNNPILPTPSF